MPKELPKRIRVRCDLRRRERDLLSGWDWLAGRDIVLKPRGQDRVQVRRAIPEDRVVHLEGAEVALHGATHFQNLSPELGRLFVAEVGGLYDMPIAPNDGCPPALSSGTGEVRIAASAGINSRSARRIVGPTFGAQGARSASHSVEPIIGPVHKVLLFPSGRGGAASGILVAFPRTDPILKLSELQFDGRPDFPTRRVDDVGADRRLPLE